MWPGFESESRRPLILKASPTRYRPFPANLMIGCYGLVASDAGSIDLELDNELEDAQWFDKESVLKVLQVVQGRLVRQARADR